MTRPLFLLTNDDGIDAPGIRALWEVLHQSNICDLAIIAPHQEQSGTGCSITWQRPIKIEERSWPDETLAWSIEGTPADCVKLGMRILLQESPTLILSGINAGSNAGRNVLHSGTAGAVIEGILRGVPGIAFSCENGRSPNYDVAQKYVLPIVEYILNNPLPTGTFLNVNVPHLAKKNVKGFKLTGQGKGRWAENPHLHFEGEDHISYWLGGKPEELTEEKHSDIYWLREGYLTATPIHVHALTDQDLLKKNKKEFESLEFQKKSLKELS
jgi:5'-nucleotidase